ncbi:MAG: carboxypeptidase regulatory-like domain-containing protein [Planctomycetota bacterium]|nr:MAG: carboxypeptidase regulatory-like domain-containing protein [Planctomycetota bacterium]
MKSRSGKVPLLALVLAAVFLAAVGYLLVQDPGSARYDQDPDLTTDLTKELQQPEENEEYTGPIIGPGRETEDNGGRVQLNQEGTQENPGGVRGRVVSPQNKGVQGAKVVLTQRLQPAQTFLAQEEGRGVGRFSAVTDSGGRFQFLTLPAGQDFDVWVFHSEYAALQANPVTAIEGETQNLADIVLREGFRVYGKVTDSADNPLEATVEIRLQRNRFTGLSEGEQRQEDEDSGRLKVVETQADGSFEIRNLAQGIWRLRGNSEGYASAQVNPVVLMAQADKSDEDGDPMSKKVDLTLGPEFILRGMVINEAREPIENAQVTVTRARPRPIFSAYATSDSGGNFEVRGLQDGVYTVAAQAEGYTTERVSNVKADTATVEVVLAVKGTVTGRVIGPDGRAVTRFHLELMKVNKGTAMYGRTGRKLPVEDRNGNYSFSNIDKGTFVLLCTAEGMAPSYSPGFFVDRGDTVRGIDIKMRRGGKIFGYITSATTGKALPGAEILLRGPDYREADATHFFGGYLNDPNNVPNMSAKSNQKGYFELEHAFPGDVQVEIRHDTHLSDFRRVQVADSADVDLGSIELYAGGTVIGTVKDQKGRPVAGGTVYLNRQPETGGWFSANQTLDAQGRFRFIGLKPGTYDLTASGPQADGFFAIFTDERSKKVYLDSGKTVTQDLVIQVD